MERKMDIPETLVGRLIVEARDSRRPSMEDVLSVIEAAFGSMDIAVEPVSAGPPTWVWEDIESRRIGFPRFYVLSESLEVPGYPLFAVRQAFSVKFDTWISMSTLVVGPDASGIIRSIVLSMVHHSGAFAGVKWASRTVTENRNSPMAGMVAVKMLMEADPPVVQADQVQEIEDLVTEESDKRGLVN